MWKNRFNHSIKEINFYNFRKYLMRVAKINTQQKTNMNNHLITIILKKRTNALARSGATSALEADRIKKVAEFIFLFPKRTEYLNLLNYRKNTKKTRTRNGFRQIF